MEENLEMVYKYFPKNIDPADLEYSYTTEINEQIKLIEREIIRKTQFNEMSEFLAKYLNCEYTTDLSLKGIFDLSKKTLFKMPNNRHHTEYPFCVVSVSIIAPLFDVYFTKFSAITANTHSSDIETDGQLFLKKNIGHIITSYFHNYKQIPENYSKKYITEIFSSKNLNSNATYYECLMSDTLW